MCEPSEPEDESVTLAALYCLVIVPTRTHGGVRSHSGFNNESAAHLDKTVAASLVML